MGGANVVELNKLLKPFSVAIGWRRVGRALLNPLELVLEWSLVRSSRGRRW